MFSLLDTIKHAKSKICVYPSPTYKALTQLNTSRRKASLMSRRKKENVRKACNRKGKEWNRLRKALFTYKLCFPEGYITVKEANIQSAKVKLTLRYWKAFTLVLMQKGWNTSTKSTKTSLLWMPFQQWGKFWTSYVYSVHTSIINATTGSDHVLFNRGKYFLTLEKW